MTEVEQLDKSWITDTDFLTFYMSICENPYLIYKPYPRQAWPIYECNKPNMDDKPNQLLVGAGGYGGKTFLGSMLALQYIDVPDYSCLVTRKNYAELTGQDSIWDNIKRWACDRSLHGDMACKPNESKLIIEHPKGGRIWFKAFDREDKKGKVKSESYNRIINDEASELHPDVLSFLFRSLRAPADHPIQLAMINLSNPGGPSTSALCENYVDGPYPYFPLDWRHNPYIDKKKYSNTLDNLSVVDRKYQKEGDWHYIINSGVLKTSWIQYYNPALTYTDNHLTYTGWDLAVSLKETADYTCSCTATVDPATNDIYILDWTRERITPPEQMQRVIQKYDEFNPLLVGIETNAYQAALPQFVLQEKLMPIKNMPTFRDKVMKIISGFTLFEQGKIYLPQAHPLLREFENEYMLFPNGVHDDLLDATNMVIELAKTTGNPYTDSDKSYEFSKRRSNVNNRR